MEGNKKTKFTRITIKRTK